MAIGKLLGRNVNSEQSWLFDNCESVKLYLVCQIGQKFQIWKIYPKKKNWCSFCVPLFNISGSYKEGDLSILTHIWIHKCGNGYKGKRFGYYLLKVGVCIYVVWSGRRHRCNFTLLFFIFRLVETDGNVVWAKNAS